MKKAEIITDSPKIAEDEELCDFCELDSSKNYGSPGGGPCFCEGCQCDEALAAFQEDYEQNYYVLEERKEVLTWKM